MNFHRKFIDFNGARAVCIACSRFDMGGARMGLRPCTIVFGTWQILMHHKLLSFQCRIIEYNALSVMVVELAA